MYYKNKSFQLSIKSNEPEVGEPLTEGCRSDFGFRQSDSILKVTSGQQRHERWMMGDPVTLKRFPVIHQIILVPS